MDLKKKNKVSVIILNWNELLLTSEAVESVLNYTDEEVEIILVDNGSEYEVVTKLVDQFSGSRVSLLTVGVNRFFGEGNNIGAESATGDILVFLNNDILVTENWLEPLIQELESDPKVGAVGPKFLYPDGTLQEAGAFIDSLGNSVQRGKGQSAGLYLFNERQEVHYVSAACIAIRKNDFLRVGGFNFIYEPAYYEDTDLCFSLRAAGLSIVYQPDSVVVHKESQTTSAPRNSELLLGVSEKNRLKFLNRWGNGITPDQSKVSFVSKDILMGASSPTVVVFTPFDLIFGGGEKYILSVAEAFSNAGFRTFFATSHRYSKTRLIALGHSFDLNLSSVDMILVNEIDFFVDIFISMGNEVSPPIRPIGKINIHHCQFPFPAESMTTDEISWLKYVDFVVVNSEFTKNHYVQAAARVGFPNLNVVVIAPPLSDLESSDHQRSSRQIVSIGRFFVHGHTKNQHVLIQAFRSLLIDHPDASLVLAGGLAPGALNHKYLDWCRELADGLPVSFHIDADPSELRGAMNSSSVYWHGAGFGVDKVNNPEHCEHFGISVAEAMGAGVIPVVVGNGGPDEIVDFGINGFKFHSVHGLVRRTSLIFNLDEESIDVIRKSARGKFEKYLSLDFRESWTSLPVI
jgi:GT2 family glycosyltransferase/glycosyltransferase involved in cell wall biosynthesis